MRVTHLDLSAFLSMDTQRDALISTFLERNKKLNLSAIRDKESVYQKHILDSIEVHKKIEFEPGSTIVDIGTWWWFPLLPLAMLNPSCTFLWVDARRKKTHAVQFIADEVGITNVKTLRSRVENMSQRFDYVTARAVWFADKIIPRCAPLVKKGGKLILYKILSSEEEPLLLDLAEWKKLFLEEMHYYKLFDDDIQRVIYIFEKI